MKKFTSLADAQATIEAWRVDYDQRRPHSSLGHPTSLSPGAMSGSVKPCT